MPTRKIKAGPSPDVVLEVVDVTRAIATDWLARNVERNRNPKPREIRKMTRDMVNDRWMVTGDTIKRTANGDTIDGANRLRAALAAFDERPDLKSIRMAVAFNVDPEAILVTDTGSKRTFGDWLKFEGQANQLQVGAIVRRIHVWRQGNYADARGYAGEHGGFIQPTTSELAALYARDADQFDEAGRRARDVQTHANGNTTAAGTAYYLFRLINPDDCHTFFEQVVTGANLADAAPTKRLRDKLLRAGRRADKTDKLTATEQLYLYVVAWNYFRHDQRIDRTHLLSLPSRGITNANFPKPE